MATASGGNESPPPPITGEQGRSRSTTWSRQFDDYLERPSFVNQKCLVADYKCELCKNVVRQPHQTQCGARVCKPCIDEVFSGQEMIPCPMSHSEMDEEELANEVCQQEGINYEDIVPDPTCQRTLLREKCYCHNRNFGCQETPMWKKLKEHEMECPYSAELCHNVGCEEVVGRCMMTRHRQRCGYTDSECEFCGQQVRLNLMETHLDDCDQADNRCIGCPMEFQKRTQLRMHQQTHPPCMTSAGKCYYYDYCGYEGNTLSCLQQHMEDSKAVHLEALTFQLHEIETSAVNKAGYSSLQATIDKRTKPLEKILADKLMEVTKIKTKRDASETSGQEIKESISTAENNCERVINITGRVQNITSFIKASKIDCVGFVTGQSQRVQQHDSCIKDLQATIQRMQVSSNDGIITWRIDLYSKKKEEAVRGRNKSVYSPPFYSSNPGYKMCLRACFNGDGSGLGKYLSLFFILLRGEFDRLVTFPFKHKVAITVLSVINPEQNVTRSFTPDGSSSFIRPVTASNMATGFPEFMLQTDLETATYLQNDSLYIKGELLTEVDDSSVSG